MMMMTKKNDGDHDGKNDGEFTRIHHYLVKEEDDNDKDDDRVGKDDDGNNKDHNDTDQYPHPPQPPVSC